jgi:hypothetical protein
LSVCLIICFGEYLGSVEKFVPSFPY